MSSFSTKQIKKAVDLYFKYNSKIEKVRCELGYPERHTLKKWVDYYKSTGKYFQSKQRETSPYSKTQKKIAVDFYIKNGKCMKETIKTLGYPRKIQTLHDWIKELAPSELRIVKVSENILKYPKKQKEQAIIDLLTTNDSVTAVAKRNKVNRTSLYFWKEKLVHKDFDISEIQELSINELKAEASKLREEVKKLRLERDILEKAAEIIKKDQGIKISNLSNKEKMVVIDALRAQYPLKELLIALQISKSSYFYQESKKGYDKYKTIRPLIHKIFEINRCCYGYRRIYDSLKKYDITLSEKVVLHLMHEEKIKVIQPKIKKYSSYAGEISPAVPNLLKRNFHASRPNQKWLTDITEFIIPSGKIYLSPIIDCFDGMVVSWTIGKSPSADLVNTMLDIAISKLTPNERPIVHSDRGSHYRWPGWIKRMKKAKLKRSMSKKGYSPDNSACEGFFGRLKNEMFYGHNWNHVSLNDFVYYLDDYIHWYNEERIKHSLGGKSPLEFRKELGFAA